MKILHTADWHIGPFPGPEKDGINLREQDTYNCIEFMIEKAKQEKPDFAVISGDVFHTAKVWSNRALNETHKAIELIVKLSEICNVVVLYGTPNHDLREQFVMLEDYFSSAPHVTIVTYPKILLLDSPDNNDSIQICALPGFDRGIYRAKFPGLSKEEENQAFTNELNNIVLGLRAQCDPSLPSVLISHYTVPGCNMESGQVSFFSQAEPVITPETINAADFDLVALGHIHRPQAVQGCKNTYYSGAVNAFNFNDEAQERGFWIHEILHNRVTMGCKLSSRFFKTPYREFVTFKMNDSDITELNQGVLGIDTVARRLWGEDSGAYGKIIRVLYNCTDENNKSFNKALLEKRLYSDGAFWVSEIMPSDIAETVNKEEFIEDNAPEDNLRDFLTNKGFDEQKIADIIEAARPIIAEALANATISQFTGVFEPVEIEVSNYRNYEAETFNFSDITFCTINGINGAGKSSLFMDAILDCLYEEPREGDLTGWIRNGEEVKSGAITFTFRIGDKTFRVTRTRAKKSGKATLNLSELIDGEWYDRSREKMRDTQEEIINILGMDSLTFRSCALIMQDQYGIFLQSDKEARMSVLANLLGLGAYEDMENISKNQLSEANRRISQTKIEIDKLSGSIAAKGGIETQMQIKNEQLNDIAEEINTITADRDSVQLRLSTKMEAAARALKLLDNIANLNTKKTTTEGNIQSQKDIISNADIILSQEQEILDGVAEHKAFLEQEKTLLSGKATYEAKQKEQQSNSTLIATIKKTVSELETEKIVFEAKRQPLEVLLSKEAELAAASERYKTEKQRLVESEKNSELYIQYSDLIATRTKTMNDLQSTFKTEYASRIATYNGYKEKSNILRDAGCINVSEAKCKFLADAQEAKVVMDEYLRKCTDWKEIETARIAGYELAITKLKEKQDSLGYNTEAIKTQKDIVSQLEAQHMEYEKLSAVKDQLRLIDERLSAIDTSLSEQQKTLADVEIEAVAIQDELLKLKVGADEYDDLKLKIAVAKNWLEKEKLLPVAKEKKDTAEKRNQELAVELSDIATEIFSRQQEFDNETQASSGADELQKECDALNKSIEGKQTTHNEIAMEIGALKQQLADIDKKVAEIQELQGKANELAEKAVIYEDLKSAFSQNGIPHNIIRSIVPLLTSKANSILGQMTGGRMGLEFETDKIQKSNRKEVVTLDILIEEYGKGKLPYLSKSGGEKVKSALSAILTLAEIKTTRSGIQLGMLFIDEPPFLDSDGIQAYCDALEAIQQRYSTIKIMAITHDPAMKARFPQSIDIVKTENGSKVYVC